MMRFAGLPALCAAAYIGLFASGTGAARASQPLAGRAQAGPTLTAPALGRVALSLLARADYAALQAYTCAPGGLAFAPYSKNLKRLHPVYLSSEELQQFRHVKLKRVWGQYDGSGNEIELTPMAYHAEFVYDVDYRSRARATVHTPAQLSANVEFSALASTFPGAGAVVYRYPGLQRNAFKDARELVMVVQAADSGWCLKALAHSEDTV